MRNKALAKHECRQVLAFSFCLCSGANGASFERMNHWFVAATLLVCCAAAGAAEPGQPGLIRSGYIYEQAPFPSCHASTIEQASNGNMVAAWFGGTDEGDKDVGIWFAELHNDVWSEPHEVATGQQADGKRYPCWNPVLYQARNPDTSSAAASPLLLFYKVGPSPSRWWGMLIKSNDGGKSWSDPQRLPDGILGPIKNKPVRLSSGELLCPSSSEDQGWRVHFERTPDLGKSWEVTPPVNDGKEFGAIQPSVLFLGGEKLLALGRTRQGKIFQVSSEDNGRSWGEMTATDLPNPNSGTDAVTLKDGRHLLVYNHTKRGRTPLNVAVSKDATQWTEALALERGPGEYSYPAVIQTSDGLVHITYTWKRERIKYAVCDPNEFR